VIRGWEIGIPSMLQFELSELIILPQYAYGEEEQQGIPANSTLIFEVELARYNLTENIEDKTDLDRLEELKKDRVLINTRVQQEQDESEKRKLAALKRVQEKRERQLQFKKKRKKK